MKELPDILTMKPKLAKRQWLKFMVDNDFEEGSVIYIQARIIKFTIDMVILNNGTEAESWTLNKLIEELDKFKRIYN